MWGPELLTAIKNIKNKFKSVDPVINLVWPIKTKHSPLNSPPPLPGRNQSDWSLLDQEIEVSEISLCDLVISSISLNGSVSVFNISRCL